MLIAYPFAGLANRLRVLASAQRAARRLNQSLAMYWRPTRECGCRFADLFENEITEIPGDGFAGLGRIRVLADRWDPVNHVLIPVNNSISPYYQPDHLLVRSCCFLGFTDEVMGGGPLPPGFIEEISAFHQALRPVAEVRQRVGAFADRYLTPATVGVHMRRTDHLKSRAVSSDEQFIRVMQRLIDHDDATQFFLATDCPDTEQLILKRFSDRVSVYPKRTPLVATTKTAPCRGTREGVQDALIDMLLLSRTRRVLGSHWSTFSCAVMYFSGRLDQVVNVSRGVARE